MEIHLSKERKMIEIKVLGYRARITRLLPTLGTILTPEDHFTAYVEFDPPAEGTISLYAPIEAKEYTPEELARAVVGGATDSLLLERRLKEQRAQEKKRREALEALAARVSKAVGLEG